MQSLQCVGGGRYEPHLFHMDKKTGAPPDDYAETGQVGGGGTDDGGGGRGCVGNGRGGEVVRFRREEASHYSLP